MRYGRILGGLPPGFAVLVMAKLLQFRAKRADKMLVTDEDFDDTIATIRELERRAYEQDRNSGRGLLFTTARNELLKLRKRRGTATGRSERSRTAPKLI
jgi:hypothetical protein